MKVLIRLLYHILIMVSIGTCGTAVLSQTFFDKILLDKEVSWIHIIFGLICVIFSTVNLYKFKITSSKILGE